tara:strand:+ start:364 stop:609 length:246 start_codon:yes stop_codon:yes gene_type:complete
MSSEVQKHIETPSKGNKKITNAKVISFPNEDMKDYINDKANYWKLYDKSYTDEDGDQLKTVIGICFMFSALILLGLYSNFY